MTRGRSGIPAHAADIPGNSSTKAVLPLGTASTDGTFEYAGDADWYRLQIVKGEHDAIPAEPIPSGRLDDADASVSLFDARGRRLKNVELVEGGIEGTGFEFTAGSTGTLSVALDNTGTIPVSA